MLGIVVLDYWVHAISMGGNFKIERLDQLSVRISTCNGRIHV